MKHTDAFVEAYHRGFGQPKDMDVRNAIDRFTNGEDLTSDENQIIDAYCMLNEYLYLIENKHG